VTSLSSLPSTAEQARHALLLLGMPAPTRLVVDVHTALFDGDLSMAGMAGLLRDRVPGFCAALNPDLTAARGLLALADWPLERRIVTPAVQQAAAFTMIIRIAEFVAMRSFAARSADRLLRELAQRVPHGVESADLADAARSALRAPRLIAAIEQEEAIRADAARRAAALDGPHQLFGVPGVPHQRGGG
jgi:hypothetical protein